MRVARLKVGSVNISLSKGFETQGFAVVDVTGLSDYGEHKMGVPGSGDISIKGVVLPGVSPVDIRRYLYGSMNPYNPVMIEAIYDNGESRQTVGRISSMKCGVNDWPTSIEVTIRRSGGWYGRPVMAALDSVTTQTELVGTFEFRSPTTVELQFTSYFSLEELNRSVAKIWIGDEGLIEMDFSRVVSTIARSTNGLASGSLIRLDVSLDYSAELVYSGFSRRLPVLGDTSKGMVPPSKDPVVRAEFTTPSDKTIKALVKSRETYLMV